MSNSIWKMPDQKPDNDNDIICLVGALPFAGYYEKFNASYVEHTTGENYTPDEIDRWCYLDDLIAQANKAERLQEQLDRAKWWLKEIVENHRYTPITTAEMALKELDDDK
jgi:hypothetical protein